MPPFRVLVAVFAGVLLGKWRNQREWQRAEQSIAEAADAYGRYLRLGNEREDRMERLVRRQLALAVMSLIVAVTSVVIAVTALAGRTAAEEPKDPIVPAADPAPLADLTFFAVSAQVIPALLIALVIGSRFLAPRSSNAPQLGPVSQLRELLQVLGVLAPFIIGEWVALRVLSNGEASQSDRSTVTAALIASGALLLTPVLMSHGRQLGTFATELVGWVIAGTAIAATIALLSM